MHTRKLALITALIAGALTCGLAQARGPDVQWSVNIGLPLPQVVVRLPVLLPPAVVVSSPAPVYREVYREVYRDAYQDVYRQPSRWDVDGDGIPNRYDSRYNPRWDRDGDGIPNRHDRDVGQRGHRDDRRDYRDYRDYRDHRDYHDARDDRRGWDGHRR